MMIAAGTSVYVEAKPVSTWAQVAKTDVNGKILHIPTPARMTKAKKGPPGPLRWATVPCDSNLLHR